MTTDQESIQRAYYAKTAHDYDALHVPEDGHDEHFLALKLLSTLIEYHGCESVLDVGAGTGRALLNLQRSHPSLTVSGIEPVAELRAQGHAKGLSQDALRDGNVFDLKLPDASVDVVCCFGVLHHVPEPRKAVNEMLRVSRRMLFISDANCFGQGGLVARTIKQVIRTVGLWPLANFLKTRGRGYSVSEGDGLYYSYSIFQDFPAVRQACEVVHLFNTTDAHSPSIYRSASHAALVGIKGRVVP